jgi:uncharacterized protein YyaL (SSP411 family)
MRRYPSAFGRLIAAADRRVAPPLEVVIVGDPGSDETRAMVTAVLSSFHPNRTVTGRHPDESVSGVPLLERRPQVDGRATAYVCQGYACRAPVTGREALESALEASRAAEP